VFVSVEFAGSEEAACGDKRLVQFINNRGLANTGVAGHQYQLRFALSRDTAE
jgi:hypothetical protein